MNGGWLVRLPGRNCEPWATRSSRARKMSPAGIALPARRGTPRGTCRTLRGPRRPVGTQAHIAMQGEWELQTCAPAMQRYRRL